MDTIEALYFENESFKREIERLQAVITAYQNLNKMDDVWEQQCNEDLEFVNTTEEWYEGYYNDNDVWVEGYFK
jgi:hypothetical protein